MSRTVFAEKFRQKVGMTPMAYLTHWRMLIAANRLRCSDVSVTTIGFSLGYGTESAFGRTFKRIHGCSPKEHRRRSEVVSDAAGAAEESQGIALKKNEI
jgi:AraC-like DNA-binding protein